MNFTRKARGWVPNFHLENRSLLGVKNNTALRLQWTGRMHFQEPSDVACFESV